jgi:hypothetical protein
MYENNWLSLSNIIVYQQTWKSSLNYTNNIEPELFDTDEQSIFTGDDDWHCCLVICVSVRGDRNGYGIWFGECRRDRDAVVVDRIEWWFLPRMFSLIVRERAFFIGIAIVTVSLWSSCSIILNDRQRNITLTYVYSRSLVIDILFIGNKFLLDGHLSIEQIEQQWNILSSNDFTWLNDNSR